MCNICDSVYEESGSEKGNCPVCNSAAWSDPNCSDCGFDIDSLPSFDVEPEMLSDVESSMLANLDSEYLAEARELLAGSV